MDRTVYLPYLSDHAGAVAAAMRAYGIQAEVLPQPNAETIALGFALCRGRECLPCLLCVGDIVRHVRRPGFDPSQGVYFLPGGPGPCRLPQYRVLLREILERMGLGDVEVVAPSSEDGYALFGDHPRATRMLAAGALAGVDVLQKALHELRPYELERGRTDSVYRRSLEELMEAVERDRTAGLIAAMACAAREFEAVPVDRSRRRTLVAVLGEVFVLLNLFANDDLVRKVEAAGGEVLIGTFSDVLDMTETNNVHEQWNQNLYLDLLGAELSRRYQIMVLRRAYRPFARLLTHPLEAPLSRVYELLRPHYDPALGGEAVLAMSRAIELAGYGASGIINVMPFSCVAGLMAAGMAPTLRAALDGIPWLDISYGGQESTNIGTRLEAFMHQVVQFQRRRRPAPVATAH
jgi:predicted nucleotide-binding protein (sugar kinase/HSP70/actin superfamily)